MENLTIIDFTSLLYSTCYNCSVDEDKTDNFQEYKSALDFYMESILYNTKADLYLTFGDSSTSFRKNEFKEFKADRKNKSKLKFINDLREYSIEKYSLTSDPELEADDLCCISANNLKNEYVITIASKDGDLRQFPGKFHNYGWQGKYYKNNNTPAEKELSDGLIKSFETLNIEEAYRNLYIQILIKGHNNKYHYLNRCGKVTAKAYINNNAVEIETVLRAFIYGINKNKDFNIKQSVKGYGLLKGIDYFNKAFRQTYLLRTLEEVNLIGSEFKVPYPIRIKNNKIDTDF